MRHACTSPLKETRPSTGVKGGSVVQAIRQVFGHLIHYIQDFKHRSIEGFSDLLEHYGRYVFDHPWRFIVIPTVICIIFSSGFLFRTPELDMELLYGLPNTRSTLAKTELNGVFPLERITYLFAVSDTGDGLLTKAQFEELYSVWSNITRIHVPRKLAEPSAVPGSTLVTKWMLEDGAYQLPLARSNNPRQPSSIDKKRDEFIYLEDVCIRDAYDNCRSLTPFDLYTSKRLWGTPIRMSDYPSFVNLRTGLGGRADALLGNITFETQGIATVVYNATSLTFRLDLQGGPNVAVESAAWEQAFLLMVHQIQVEGIRLMAKTERSVNDELSVSSRLQGSDLVRLLCASIFVSSFSVFMNSSLDRYRSKWLSSAVGVGTTVLAYGGGVGLCHLIGIKHVPPAEATPFMILGICVDDIFVIINAYSFSYLHSDDARTRIGLSVRDAGVSVTITTLTNITAFAVGASSMYYSIRVFCILTVVGLFAGYLLCLTIFVGALSIDAHREQKYRGAPLFKPVTPAVLDTAVALPLPTSKCTASQSNSPQRSRGAPLAARAAIVLPHVPFPNSPQVPGETTSESSSSSEPPCQKLKSTTPAYPTTKDDRVPPTTCTGYSSVADSSEPGDHPDWDTELQLTGGSQHTNEVDQLSSNQSPSLQIGGSDVSTTPLRNSPEDDEGSPNELLDYYRRCTLTHELADGLYSVEQLDNHLVVAERVAEALTSSRLCLLIPWFAHKKRLGRSKSDAGCQKLAIEFTSSKLTNPLTGVADKDQSNTNEGFSCEFDGPNSTPQCGDDCDPDTAVQCARRRVTDTPNTPASLEADSDLPPTFTSSPEDLSRKCSNPLNMQTPGPVKIGLNEAKAQIGLISSTSLVRLVKVKQSLIPLDEIDFVEPRGTVGKSARKFFIQVYGPNLMHPFWKVVVLLSFLACFIFALVKCFSVKAGLSLREVAPMDSYLVDFYDVRERDFANYGDECVVFFPKGGEWWHPAVINDLQRVNDEIQASGGAVFVMNGMAEFLKYLNGTSGEIHSNGLIDNKQRFNWLFQQWLTSPRGMNFATHFQMEDGVLGAWKFYYWMPFIDNTSVAIAKIQDVRNILQSVGSFTAHVFTPLAVLWETDPIIFRSTWTNMLIALITTGLVGILLIPDFRSGLLVLVMIVIIDVNVFGFMPLWHLNLNMLTMVNLILSIGFAVDYTTHITHCFSHAKGTTRNRRSIETLVLMGLPISNGMLSTYAAVAALATAKKYVLIVTFQMVTTVLTFAFVHGVILMPVILSLIGPFKTHEVDVIRIKNGIIVSSHSMDISSGMLVESHKSGRLTQPIIKGYGDVKGCHPVNSSAAPHVPLSGIRRRQLV